MKITTAQWIVMAAGVVALALLPLGLKGYGVYLLSLWCVYVMANFGLNLVVGYAGLMSLCQAAFLGIGAYTAGILMNMGFSFWVVVPVAALNCFLLGLLIGFPALRVQHHYLAFATLGFNVLVSLFMRNEQWLTGGPFGIANVPRPSVFGHVLNGSVPFYYLILASTVVLAALMAWLLRSPWGRAFTALRDNPIRAESLGVNITLYTLLAFAIGAVFAGVAGTFYATLVQFIDPIPFSYSASLMLLLAVIAGGSGRFFGPVVGAAIVVLLPEWLRFAQDWYLVIFGFAIVALMIWLPGGLLALPERLGFGDKA
ncbi:MAG: branched-chain amino acid ABC transporter permease [Burkholderiales bacterium]|jgi:branched-chain amino acid transport system permease protein|nr:branched-chain amino acid ABC transporter permease [Burkholderiales bacterium]